ncbi:MAG: CHASE domain-containing protein [Polyangiaceae bacterium]
MSTAPKEAPVSRHRPVLLAAVTVAVFFALSVGAYRLTLRVVEEDGRQRFRARVDDVDHTLRYRLMAYEQVLLSALGFMRASEEVSRSEFRTYVETLDLAARYPGVQGVGYSQKLMPAEVEGFERRVRADFPDFALRPAGKRENYTSIVFLEPLSGRNLRAFGFDMFAEPTRRAAMEAARDTGNPSVSGPVRLVQETSEKPQAGFLIYVPHYAGSPTTVEARRANLRGYVYSPFRMGDFMEAIGDDRGDVALSISDVGADAVLYDDPSLRERFGADFRPAFQETRTIDLRGRTWRVSFTSRPRALAIPRAGDAYGVLGAGLLITSLLTVTLWMSTTVRRRAESIAEQLAKAHRQGEVRLRAILDNVVDAVLTLDERGLVESANPATQATFAHDEGALVGLPFTALLADGSREAFDECLRGVVGKPSARCELTALRGGSEAFPVELTLSPMRVGDRFKLVAIVRDITDRRRVDKMKNEFISTVSHELRTPLTSIRGALGMIAAGAIPPKLKTLADIALRNSERLVRLINDILNIEKIEAGRYELTILPQSLHPLLEQCVEANRAFADQYGVRLDLDQTGPDVTVAVDGDALSQVLTNLVSNAVKFSPRGELVRVSATPTETGVRVSVTDHGRGIPPEFQERIFQKFSQAEASDARVKGGTGLGLSISKALVEAMKGSIGFSTRMGQGTTFHFDLRAAAATSERRLSRAPAAAQRVG